MSGEILVKLESEEEKTPTPKETRLEIQDDFAATFARHSYNLDNWQVVPHQINHVFQDWFSAWIEENEDKNPGIEYPHSPRPEHVVREMFGKFFTSLKERNHVFVPGVVQEAAIQEYFDD